MRVVVVLVPAFAVVRALLLGADRRGVVGSSRRWRLPAPARLAAALADAGVAAPADAVVTAWVAAAAVTAIAALAIAGPGLALIGLAVVAAGPALVLHGARGRARREVDAALPELLDAVARALRTGATLHQALAEAGTDARGRVADDVALVLAAVARGVPLVAALEAWSRRFPTAGVRLAAAALALAVEAGGAAARAVDGVAATLRANLAVAAEVRAQASQARLSALVIALAPVAFAALAAAMDPGTVTFLTATPFGLACLAAGLTLDGVALWWMQRITAAPP